MEKLVKVVVFDVDVPKDEKDLKDTSIYSSSFTMKINNCTETSWKISCNLNYDKKSCVAIFLCCDTKLSEPLNVGCSFHLISSNKTSEMSWKNSTQLSKSSTSCGRSNFFSHKHLLDNSKDLFVSGRKIRIVVKILCYGGSSPSKVASSSDWLKNLHKTMDHSDLIIKSADRVEFKAHKAIVCGKSQVLNQMFKHQMTQNSTGVLTMAYRSDVVKELIRLIYCADFSSEFVNHPGVVDIYLYGAAERYELEEIKVVCLKSIYSSLEVGNALELIIFAKMFNLKKLYSLCLFMIYANFGQVLKSDEWKRIDDKPEFLQEITQRAYKLSNNGIWTSDEF